MRIQLLLPIALLASGCSAKADSTQPAAPNSDSSASQTSTSNTTSATTSGSSDSEGAAFEGSYSTKPSALLKSVGEVKQWNAGVESLERALAHLDKTCGGVKPAVDIDYDSFAGALGGDLPSIAHVMGHCEAVVAGASSQCGWKDEVLEAAIRANLKRVVCEFDASAKQRVVFSWKDGVYRGGWSRISENVHNDATQWVTKNVPPAP